MISACLRLAMTVLFLTLIGCASQAPWGRIILPDRDLPAIQWREDEKSAPFVLRTLKRTQDASFHIVRLLKAEEPHVHDTHDGTVFVLRGKGRIHFENRSVDLSPGDVLEIPRGVPHWAENAGPGACEAYVIYTPAFDGKDRRPVTFRS